MRTECRNAAGECLYAAWRTCENLKGAHILTYPRLEAWEPKQREDERPASVQVRLQVDERRTAPLFKFYR
jgi:adenylate kinase family enzyme